MNKVIVSLGSNHNHEKYIPLAKEALAETFTTLKVSTFELTKPIGEEGSDLFLNGSLLLETTLNLDELKMHLKSIEYNIQQKAATDKITRRVIDLDLTVWNGDIIDPDYYKRSYLQKAVNELSEKS